MRWAVLAAFTAAAAVCPPGQTGARPAAAGKPRAAATARCSAQEQSISNVLALREHMIMIAMKCGRGQEDYTNIVRRFGPVLQANETAVTAWFTHEYGLGGAGQKDKYTTALVDVVSREAIRQARDYCFAAANRLLDGLDDLKSVDDLPRFAAATDTTPANMTLCGWATRNH
jgi:hypothetical protein